MGNYIFLVLIFLFLAIEAVCIYKFFRLKKWKVGIISLLYFLLTLILTLSYFSTRNAVTEDELTSLIRGLSDFNLFAILILILNIGMIISSVISYVKVITMEKNLRKWVLKILIKPL